MTLPFHAFSVMKWGVNSYLNLVLGALVDWLASWLGNFLKTFRYNRSYINCLSITAKITAIQEKLGTVN